MNKKIINKKVIVSIVVVVILGVVCIVAAPALMDSIRSIHVIPPH